MGLNDEQPAPTQGDGERPDIWSLVLEDMQERRAAGHNKYGTYLHHDNGRDHLVDAYQEALDLAVYLRAEIERRKVSALLAAARALVALTPDPPQFKSTGWDNIALMMQWADAMAALRKAAAKE